MTWDATLYYADPEVRARKNAQSKAWRERHPRAHKAQSLKRRYAMTLDEWDALWAAQDGRCAICRRELVDDRSTHVDHNHVTGRRRGLLCGTCNRGLGQFSDDINRLVAAIRYLVSQ